VLLYHGQRLRESLMLGGCVLDGAANRLQAGSHSGRQPAGGISLLAASTPASARQVGIQSSIRAGGSNAVVVSRLERTLAKEELQQATPVSSGPS
jgi:hypothetical protein